MNDFSDPETTHDLRQLFSRRFTFTKRQLGVMIAVISGLAFVGILGLDLIGGGREGGIGPTQQIALFVTGVATLVGLSLIPLGDDPA